MILFLNSVSIFITNFFNSVSGRLPVVLNFFFQGLSLILSTGSRFLCHLFYLTFSLSMNLGETVIHQSLKSVFMWERLCVEIRVLAGFGGAKIYAVCGGRTSFLLHGCSHTVRSNVYSPY